VWCGLGKGSVIVYCVVSFGKKQRNVILCGEDLGKGSIMVYYVVRFSEIAA
jgi:hypothetical protein